MKTKITLIFTDDLELHSSELLADSKEQEMRLCAILARIQHALGHQCGCAKAAA